MRTSVLSACCGVLLALSTAGCGGVDRPPGSQGVGPEGTVVVPGGAFQMGCNSDTNCEADELPYHEVDISEFAIDRLEVSQADYQKCVDAGSCTKPKGKYDPAQLADFPVASVTFTQATEYCAWAEKRLPSEAEWEKAARGTDGRAYPWGNDAPDCMIANGPTCGGKAMPVGTFLNGASPYGALDMAGNVIEWVNDWYEWHYYETSPTSDPTGPAPSWGRGVRGGGFGNFASLDLRVADRAGRDPANPADDYAPQIGFRCAVSL